MKSGMYRTPIPWSSKCHVREMSTMGSRAHMKQMGSQLQPNDAAFSVGNFHAREQPQLQPKDAAFSMKYLARETLGSSARRRPLEPQLQQLNASFSAGMELQWQPKKAAFSVDSNKDKQQCSQKNQTWEKKFENESSRRNKGTSSGIHEQCEEFVHMFCEKLQEFAMILIKKYHYNFPIEYFDDYRGSFNKEEFLKVEQPNENSLAKSKSLVYSSYQQVKECPLEEDPTEDMKGSKHIIPLVLAMEKAEEYMKEEGEEEVLENDSLSSTLTSAETPDAIDLLKQQNKEPEGKEQRIAPDTLLGTSHM